MQRLTQGWQEVTRSVDAAVEVGTDAVSDLCSSLTLEEAGQNY